MVHKIHRPDDLMHYSPRELKAEIKFINRVNTNDNHFLYDSLKKRKRDLEKQIIINRID